MSRGDTYLANLAREVLLYEANPDEWRRRYMPTKHTPIAEEIDTAAVVAESAEIATREQMAIAAREHREAVNRAIAPIHVGEGDTLPPRVEYDLLPRRNSIVVRRVEDERIEQRSDQVIIEPFTGEKAQFAEILAVGPAVKDQTLRPGVRVLLEKYTGSEVTVHREDFLIITEKQIIGVMLPAGTVEPADDPFTAKARELAAALGREIAGATFPLSGEEIAEAIVHAALAKGEQTVNRSKVRKELSE